jgi:hypothetical protein
MRYLILGSGPAGIAAAKAAPEGYEFWHVYKVVHIRHHDDMILGYRVIRESLR